MEVGGVFLFQLIDTNVKQIVKKIRCFFIKKNLLKQEKKEKILDATTSKRKKEKTLKPLLYTIKKLVENLFLHNLKKHLETTLFYPKKQIKKHPMLTLNNTFIQDLILIRSGGDQLEYN